VCVGRREGTPLCTQIVSLHASDRLHIVPAGSIRVTCVTTQPNAKNRSGGGASPPTPKTRFTSASPGVCHGDTAVALVGPVHVDGTAICRGLVFLHRAVDNSGLPCDVVQPQPAPAPVGMVAHYPARTFRCHGQLEPSFIAGRPGPIAYQLLMGGHFRAYKGISGHIGHISCSWVGICRATIQLDQSLRALPPSVCEVD
jgi:hypothetical protein